METHGQSVGIQRLGVGFHTENRVMLCEDAKWNCESFCAKIDGENGSCAAWGDSHTYMHHAELAWPCKLWQSLESCACECTYTCCFSVGQGSLQCTEPEPQNIQQAELKT